MSEVKGNVNKAAEKAKARAREKVQLEERIKTACLLTLFFLFAISRFDGDALLANIWIAAAALFGFDVSVGTNARIGVFIWAIAGGAMAWGWFLCKQKELS